MYLSNGVESVDDGDAGEEDDARRVVVVVVEVPNDAREDLEDVEGREDLAYEEHEDGREVNANRVLAVQFASVPRT